MGGMGYFDLQVNGYAGVDFNSDRLDADEVERVCRRLEAQDVEGILATIITDSLPVMEARLRRLADLVQNNTSIRRVIRGIHIEGPFINPEPGYRGAHPVDAIMRADSPAMQRLLESAGGLTRLVTLAPECDPGLRVTRELADQGIVVSAGHTNATRDELKAAIDAGLTMFTHLGNGCPATMPRHDNIIQRALSLGDQLWSCFIADGAHIPFFALRNYLDITGVDKAIVVTDAIVAADLGPGTYRFGRWVLEIGEDLVPQSPDRSHLVGSAITMPKSFHNLTQYLHISPADAKKLMTKNPQIALGQALSC
jgi:N-acetylglucosamine-6-phosphate deacetylase